VGCGFVEFASVNEAQKALQKMNGENLRSREIFLDVVELAPYPLRPKYNHAEKLWHERESLLKKQKEYEMLSERTEFCGFSDSSKNKISAIERNSEIGINGVYNIVEGQQRKRQRIKGSFLFR
jgi:RNA recognition motif-containing protein